MKVIQEKTQMLLTFKVKPFQEPFAIFSEFNFEATMTKLC